MESAYNLSYRIPEEEGGSISYVDDARKDSNPDESQSLIDIHKRLAALRGHKLIVQVRVLYGDNEYDTKLIFNYEDVKVSDVCDVVRKKLMLTEVEASLFSLWTIGKDFGMCGAAVVSR